MSLDGQSRRFKTGSLSRIRHETAEAHTRCDHAIDLSKRDRWFGTCRSISDRDASALQPRRRSGVISPSSTESLRKADTADKLFETVTEAAFGQRRKMLRQSLRSLGADVTALLSAADVSPMARAETIPIDGFVSLARALAVQHGLRHDAGA